MPRCLSAAISRGEAVLFCLLAASIAVGAYGVGIAGVAASAAASVCAGGACESEVPGGLSVLQFSASSRPARVPGGVGGKNPIPELQSFKGVSMLIVELPISRVVAEREASNLLFGEERSRSPSGSKITLDRDRSAQLMIADFPDAKITWTGVPGESEIQNLPHHLLQVRLPIVKEGEKIYQSVYASTDDDRAMMIYRLGSGIPAKIANFSFQPLQGSLVPQSIHVTRRGLKLLQATQIQDQSAFEKGAAEQLLQAPDLNWWTPLTNYVPIRSFTMKFLDRVTKARVTSARKLQVSLAVEPSEFDPLYWLFSDLTPLAAYWIEADLDVTTTSVPVVRPLIPGSAMMDDKMSMLRLGGLPSEGPSFSSQGLLPKQCDNADVVWLRMKLNPDKVEPYLLPGMTLDSDVGVISMQRCNPFYVPVLLKLTMPLVFNELWVTVSVRYKNMTLIYPLLLMSEDDVAVMGGQDFGGLPKKLANATFELSPPPSQGKQPGFGTSVAWSVSRRGRPVMNFTGTITQETTNSSIPGITDGYVWALLIGHQFPRHPDLDRPFYVFLDAKEFVEGQRAVADMTVALGSHEQEPLGEWFQGAPLDGGYARSARDWLPGMDELANDFTRVPANEYLEWWKRNFQVLYM